jgi:hypothetical protein
MIVKIMLMSAVEMREEVHQLVDQIDEKLLEAVYALLGTYVQKEDSVLGYETDGTPVTASAFLEQADKAMEAVERGEYITVEELDRRTKEWLRQRIK